MIDEISENKKDKSFN